MAIGKYDEGFKMKVPPTTQKRMEEHVQENIKATREWLTRQHIVMKLLHDAGLCLNLSYTDFEEDIDIVLNTTKDNGIFGSVELEELNRKINLEHKRFMEWEDYKHTVRVGWIRIVAAGKLLKQ